MRARLKLAALLPLALGAVGCSRVGSSAWAEEAPAARDPKPTDIEGCKQALEKAQDQLHASTTVEARRAAQLRLQDAQNRLLELQAEARRKRAQEELARLRAHAPVAQPAEALETASGTLEHADGQQLILHSGVGQLQLDTDGMTRIELDGQPIKLKDLPQGSDVRAAFEAGSTPPVARRIEAHRIR